MAIFGTRLITVSTIGLLSTLIYRRLNAYECASFFVLHYAHTVRKREWRLHCELRRVDSISRLLLPRVRWTEIWTWASIDRFNIELPSLETVYHQLSFKLKQSPANFKRMTTLSGLCKKDYCLTLMRNSQTILFCDAAFDIRNNRVGRSVSFGIHILSDRLGKDTNFKWPRMNNFLFHHQ